MGGQVAERLENFSTHRDEARLDQSAVTLLHEIVIVDQQPVGNGEYLLLQKPLPSGYDEGHGGGTPCPPVG